MTTNTVKHTPDTREWQDISTAPTDGTEVIIFDPSNNPSVFTAACSWGKEWHASVEDRHAPEDDYYGDAPKKPSHWMPLPAAPTENGKG